MPSPPPADPLLPGTGDQPLSLLDAASMAKQISGGIFGEVAPFATADPGYQATVRHIVEQLLTMALRLLEERRSATRSEMAQLVELCMPPTERGVTLEDMLGVFRAAGMALFRGLDALVDAEPSSDGDAVGPKQLLEIGQLGFGFIFALSHGVTVRYLEGDRVWLHRADAERALVAGVLGTPPAIEEATRASQSLGVRLFDTWRCSIYLPLPGTPADFETARGAIDERRRGPGVEQTGALALFGDELVLLSPGKVLPPPAPVGWTVGIGRSLTGTQGIRQSYDEASEAAEVARRRGLRRLRSEHALLDRVFLGSLSAGELAEQVLQPLMDEPEGRRQMLLETLEAYLDNGASVTATARTLNLHAQSLRYRLKVLRDVLEDELDDPEIRLQLHMAVKSRRLG